MNKIILISAVLSILHFTGLGQSADKTEVTVANKYFNVLYRGLNNPIQITAENISCSDLYVTTSNASMDGDSCNYTIMPGLGSTSIVYSYEVSGKDTIELDQYQFRVKNLPAPSAYFAGKTGTTSTIDWNDLNAGAGILGKFENLEPLVRAKVFEFDFTAINSKGEKFNASCYSAAISKDVTRIIQLLDSGSYIVISNIKASGPEDIVWNLENIELRLVK